MKAMLSLKLKNYPEIKHVIQTCFPSYRKQVAHVTTFPVGGVKINSYWEGGSRQEFGIVELATLHHKQMPTSTHPYFDIVRVGIHEQNNTSGQKLVTVDHVGNVTLTQLPPGYALVKGGIFCGRVATAYVYFNESDLPKQIEGES